MAPAHHLDWFQDNREWFGDLSLNALAVDVPACPGWNVENVVTHLALGLGLGYPYALSADPDCPDDQAFKGVPWPAETPTGQAALDAFRFEIDRCLRIFRETDPATPCYTYEGPGTAAFWFRRAAIETTLHRMDVIEALGHVSDSLRPDRAFDAIAEAIEFALPLAARWTGTQLPGVLIRPADGTENDLLLGTGEPGASISGSGDALLLALWGRSDQGVTVDGDEDLAATWMSLVEAAFSGR